MNSIQPTHYLERHLYGTHKTISLSSVICKWMVRGKNCSLPYALSGLFLIIFSSITGAGPPQKLPPDPGLAEQLIGITSENYRIRESNHFTICYDTDYAAVRSMTGRLEGTYDAIARFSKSLKWTAGLPDDRMGVILFDQFDAFTRYAKDAGLSSSTMAGFYSQQTNLSAFCHTLHSPAMKNIVQQIDQIEKRLQKFNTNPSNRRGVQSRSDATLRQLQSLQLQRDAIVKRINRYVIQHEVAHQMFFNIGVHALRKYNPYWLVEGLACQFETPQTDPRGQLRRTNHMRLADFRDALGVGLKAKRVTQQEYLEAVRDGRWIPLVDFITDPDLFVQRDEKVTFRYAQAWALVFYLHRIHKDEFSRYLHAITVLELKTYPDREHILNTFESIFSRVDESMEEDWINTMLKLRLDIHEAGRE